MPKYLKVMFGNKGANYEYKINEVNTTTNWHPNALKGRNFGGFNYTTEDCLLRWLHRGDTIYDVTIPTDAEVVKVEGATTIYRTNKIILTNPRPVDGALALHLYQISNIPEKSYYKALAVVSIMGYQDTAYQILHDKINKNNIKEVLSEWNDFINHKKSNNQIYSSTLVAEIDEYLYEIDSPILISRFVSKSPLIKELTNDKVINITGESGSGKSTFTKKYLENDEYLVIDTDLVMSQKATDNKIIIELRQLFSDKDKDYLISNFDEFYSKTLAYLKDISKTIVIDSAQFRNLKDLSLLKGQMIVIRTDINTCYERVLKRWQQDRKNYTKDEYIKYINKKKPMFTWYKSINKFITKLEEISK